MPYLAESVHASYRITCTVTTCHPGDVVELPPELLPLQEAANQEEHDSMLQQQQQQVCIAPCYSVGCPANICR